MAPKKVDVNQPRIVAELRARGCSVQHIHEVGRGCPDILVGYQGANFVFEIKNPEYDCKLTEDEERWHREWRGQVHTVTNTGEAWKIISALKKQRL